MIDLHTHSTVSDGSDPPERIPELAAAAGCSAVALTDHDRLDGVEAARRRGVDLGIEVISGCELSCEVERGTMHVLVYFLEPESGPLQDELVRLQQVRDERNLRMVETLRTLGLPVTNEELVEEAGGIGIGRPHVARILVRKGVVGSMQEAFDVWLARGRPAYVEKERLTAQRALGLVAASGALSVLAHPLSLDLDPAALSARLAELRALGLAGVEAVYGRYSPAERALIETLAREHDLVATGGSDHHGEYKPDLKVGVGRGDLHVADSVLDDLRARL